MMMRDYDIVAQEFFDELTNRGGSKLCMLFDEMLTVRVVKSGREMSAPISGTSLWLQGQISICDEYLTKLKMALDAKESQAKDSDAEGFRKGGV